MSGDTRISPARLALAVKKLRAERDEIDLIASDPIAVIGMGCRFPAQANSPEAFWSALVEGRCGFIEMSDRRWTDKAGLRPEQCIGSYFDRVDEFDAEYFGISPREAAQMDPQQRLLLEVAWEALWDAGLEPASLGGSDTGVFAAIYNSDYARMLFQNRSALTAHAGIGTAHSIAAGRLAFLLDIKGPNVAVDSACSSSLVATHMAVQSLRAHECSTAIVGASSLKVLPDEVLVFTKWGMLAHDGRCKTFDAAADGFIPGEGCGVIVLRRLSDALQRGDRIRAVIRGSAVNQDGRSTVLTAPNGLSQQAVMRTALANARLGADEVSFVETHGTGTSLGDPIEVEALHAVYGAQCRDLQPCSLGAVKTNFGHMEAAAGIAGIIKTVLCLENEALPKNLHFEKLNPQIQLDGSRLVLLTQPAAWPRGEKARVGAVSSFGLGGTNAHVLVEEAPTLPRNHSHPNGRAIPLPRREWSRQRYWLADATPVIGREGYIHPLLGRPFDSAFVKGRLFQSELAVGSTRYLADHRLADQVILPFAAFLEIARAAVAKTRENTKFLIRDFTLRDPLFLSSEPRKLQVLTGENQIEIASESESGWLRHGGASVHESETVSSGTDLAALQTRFPEEIDPGEIYRRLESTGLTYGPRFRVIQKAWRAPGESLALLRLPQELHAEAGEYGIHPVLLDGCLQTVIAACRTCDRDLYLPIALDELQISGAGPIEVWVHSQILKSGPELITARIVVMDTSGAQIASFNGFQAKRTSKETILQDTKRAAPVYEIVWRVRPLPKQDGRSLQGEQWLLVESEPGTCARLADALSMRGAACTIVSVLDVPQVLHKAQWSAVLYDARSIAPGASDAAWSHPERRSIELILAFAKRFTAASAHDVPGLWVLASSAVAVMPEEDVSLAQAPLVGMLRTLGVEQSPAAPVLIDTASSYALDDHESILREIDASAGDPVVAIRGGLRYVARMALHAPQSPHPHRLAIGTPGRLDDLRLEPIVRSAPAAHEVEIEVRATGLNFRDVLNALGMFGVHDPRFGAECAGTVTRVGDDVHDVMVGQHVMAFAPFSFQSHVNVHRKYLVALPPGMSFAKAAGIPVAFLTAWYGLRPLAGLSAGQRILIHAAAGGLGQAALQLAKDIGAVIYATAGNEQKREFLRSQGVQHVFDSRSLSFRLDVLKATDGAGVDVVLNSLADDFIQASLETVARDGCFLEVGKRGIWTQEQVSAFRDDIRYFSFDLGDIAIQDPDRIAEMLRELMPQFAATRLQPLKTTIYPIEDASLAFRTMAQAGHVGKIVLTHRPPKQHAIGNIVSGGTVLITGGLGALGTAVAGWLAEMGAGHLVLCSRNAADESVVAELRARGVAVTVARADVACVEQLEKLLNDIRRECPPLTAVFHAAGIVQDAMLGSEDWPSYVAATAAKIEGAWNLHRLTKQDPIELMVLFSSAASVLGSAGQGSYAAGNAFLDALAHFRSSRGMITCSVNWGAWASAGMAARLSSEHSARWQRQGVRPMDPSAALRALKIALESGPSQIAVMDMDWERFVANRKSSDTALIEEIVRSRNSEPSASTTDSNALAGVLKAPASDRKALLAHHIRERARKVLAMDPGFSIADDVPLQDIGLDSLMALELRNELTQSLGLTLSAGLLFNYPTVAELSEHLLSLLSPATVEAAPEAGAATAELIALEAMSDEDAELLLLKELGSPELDSPQLDGREKVTHA